MSCCNVLNIPKLDSAALIPYKESLCLKLDDDSYIVLPGIKSSFSYLTELLTKKREEMAGIVRQGKSFYGSSTCSVTNTNDTNNITMIFNPSSLTSVSASSQSNIGLDDVTKSIDHHRKRIILNINQWVQKNKKSLSNADFSLVQGIDYDVNVTVNPDTAIVQCACGAKSTLKLVHTSYQVKMLI